MPAAGDTPATRVRVLVCGEALRGDDGAAIRAAEFLPPDVRAIADLAFVGQLEIDALVDLPEGATIVIADAATGIEPGRVVVLALEQLAGAAAGGAAGGGAIPASSHALPPDQILALAAEIRGEPPRGVFVGIGAGRFEPGEDLSEPVRAGLPAFASTLAKEIRRLASLAGDARQDVAPEPDR